MLFTELPPLERPRAAREAGFGLVESWWPVAPDPDEWAAAVVAAGVGVAALNADAGDIAAGERGFCTVAERDDDTFAALDAALRLAAQVGAPAINLLPGKVVADRPAAAQWAHAVEVYREAGRRAEASGRIVVVEPINAIDVPGYLLPTPGEARLFLEEVGHDHVRLLYDAYHAAKAGGEPIREASELVGVIGHVQYADFPGRGAPGSGTVDLAALVETLHRAGYDGAVGLELDPAGSTLSAIRGLPKVSGAAPFPDTLAPRPS